MSKNEAPNNIIQFPGKKKEAEKDAPKPVVPSEKPVASKVKPAKAKLAGSVLAIALATAAVNHYAFGQKVQSLDFSSSSRSSVSRAIASVEPMIWQRDADWEKNMAEKLASPQLRGIASTEVGHDATPEENLRWGTLEEKYTILYRPQIHVINSITLQDPTTDPSYILDRGLFLKTYGKLLAPKFGSAQLKSVEVGHDRTIEAYTLYDMDKHAKGEARFELDTHKRLLSLKIEPAQI